MTSARCSTLPTTRGTDIITTHFEYHSMESNILKLDMLGHDDPTMIRMLEDLTGVNAQAIPLDDRDTMSIFTTSEALGFADDPILGPTGAVAIPEFGTSFVRGMLVDTQPTEFDVLIRLSGFSHGTDVWLGNAKDLIVKQGIPVNQAIGCRDDIMIFLISCGMPEKRSFKIMEAVRKGRGTARGGGGGDDRRRCARLVYRLLQEDQIPIPQGPRGGLCDDGLPHCLV